MNDHILHSPPVIKPLASGIVQPLWSVMIPTYNCSKYLKQTLESVLAQDPGIEKMQIDVVDDNSTDANVEELINTIGKGRIKFYRQPQHCGSLRNFETCLNHAHGKYIHLLHGDDYVEPGFYVAVERLFQQYPDAGAVCTGFSHVDEDGNFLYPNQNISHKEGLLKDWLYKLAQGQKLQPPSVVVKRSVYEHLGGFFGMQYGEDWEMWVRVAAHYSFAYTPLQLANYRIHDNSITSRSFQSGNHIKDLNKAISLVEAHLPDDKKQKLKSIAQKNWSKYLARTSDIVYHRYKKPKQAVTQAILSLKLNVNRITIYFLLKLYVKKIIRYKP
jgi:glycosyltransferase involved in cell wall biosynthesis